MGNLLTNYYLEAIDSYPYDLKQTLESLNYALAYDNEHAPSLCLMGKILFEQMKNYDEAAHYFELAMVFDRNYPDTYLAYIDMLMEIKEFTKARKVIEKADNISAICEACLLIRKGLWLEKQNMLNPAKNALKLARSISTDNGEIEGINRGLERIKTKEKNKRK